MSHTGTKRVHHSERKHESHGDGQVGVELNIQYSSSSSIKLSQVSGSEVHHTDLKSGSAEPQVWSQQGQEVLDVLMKPKHTEFDMRDSLIHIIQSVF